MFESSNLSRDNVSRAEIGCRAAVRGVSILWSPWGDPVITYDASTAITTAITTVSIINTHIYIYDNNNDNNNDNINNYNYYHYHYHYENLRPPEDLVTVAVVTGCWSYE